MRGYKTDYVYHLFICIEIKFILFVKQQSLLLHHYFEGKSEQNSLHIGFLILSRKEFVNIMPSAFQRETRRRENTIRFLKNSFLDALQNWHNFVRKQNIAKWVCYSQIYFIAWSEFLLSIDSFMQYMSTFLKIKHVHDRSKIFRST